MYKRFFLIFSLFYFQMISAQPTRIINFAGMEWVVRSGRGNPASNLWSDSKLSVWVDNQNRLHLKIRKIEGKWYAAEIFSLRPTHFGVHKFYISNRIDLLDKNVVAAVFIYKDDEHEVDIEFSKWKSNKNRNTQYVVQPEMPENMKRFDLKLSGNFSTHTINWKPDKIYFQSYYGHYTNVPNTNFMVNNWVLDKKKLIDDSTYKIHINLWLVDSLPPSDKKEAEIIIASVDSPISSLQIEGKSFPELSFYPNHYYNHIFVYYASDFKNIYYIIRDDNGKIIKNINSEKNYFFINFLNLDIGKYKLEINIDNKKYFYDVFKNY